MHRDFNLHDITSDVRSEQNSKFWGRVLHNSPRTHKVEMIIGSVVYPNRGVNSKNVQHSQGVEDFIMRFSLLGTIHLLTCQGISEAIRSYLLQLRGTRCTE
jgi:hypothetical protein